MFAIQCVNRSYNYNRYVGLKSSGKPQIIYEGSSNYLKAIKGFKDKESAEEFLITILTRKDVDYTTISPVDIIDYALITNSTDFKIIEYKIQDNELKIFKSYSFDTSEILKNSP